MPVYSLLHSKLRYTLRMLRNLHTSGWVELVLQMSFKWNDEMYRKRECVLAGEKVLLVPYSAHHVPKYHGWMEDPGLRELTASEPLTLEQEYEMQQSWMVDENKCTFVVLCKEIYQDPAASEIDAMVGDINLFFSMSEAGTPDYTSAEIDVMIAEPLYRGKGLGSEAAKLMIAYSVHELGVREYSAKIARSNAPSLNMFVSKLGFKEVSFSDVFNEVTLNLGITNKKEFKPDHSSPLAIIKVALLHLYTPLVFLQPNHIPN